MCERERKTDIETERERLSEALRGPWRTSVFSLQDVNLCTCECILTLNSLIPLLVQQRHDKFIKSRL